MLNWDLERVESLTDRGRAEALAQALRRAGITAFVFPSDRVIATWDVEVPASDVAAALMVAEEIRSR